MSGVRRIKYSALRQIDGYQQHLSTGRTAMSHQHELYQWIDTVVMHLPSLSKPQVTGLAFLSFGMKHTRL